MSYLRSPKYQMKDFSAKNKLVVYITSRVKSIPNYEQLRGTTELVKFICNASESEINNSGKKIYQRIDKKEILNDVMGKLFPNMTDAEKQTLDDQVLFLLNNNHIKTLGVWKSFVKFLFGSTTDNMRDAYDGLNPQPAELDLRNLVSNHQTVVNNHYHGGGGSPVNAFYQMPQNEVAGFPSINIPSINIPSINIPPIKIPSINIPSINSVYQMSKSQSKPIIQYPYVEPEDIINDGELEEEPPVVFRASPSRKAASVPSRTSRPSIPSIH